LQSSIVPFWNLDFLQRLGSMTPMLDDISSSVRQSVAFVSNTVS